jgi:hypothetical protein
MIPQTLIGYGHWTNCWSNVHLLSLPERGLFHCCPSCCTHLPLTRRRGPHLIMTHFTDPPIGNGIHSFQF